MTQTKNSCFCRDAQISIIKKSNFHCTSVITSKRVTNEGVQLRGLAPGQHSCVVTATNLIGQDLNPRPPAPNQPVNNIKIL